MLSDKWILVIRMFSWYAKDRNACCHENYGEVASFWNEVNDITNSITNIILRLENNESKDKIIKKKLRRKSKTGTAVCSFMLDRTLVWY